MATSYGALCNDFYVNTKLALKMDLPTERETVLHLMDAIRKSEPSMDRFRRFDDEIALESSRKDAEYRWLGLRRTSVRTGHVNPQSMEDAGEFHKLILRLAPYHLTVSPLDVDHIELLFGFDLECAGNHDEVVYEALFADTPLANLLRLPAPLDGDEGRVEDVQPLFGVQLDRSGQSHAMFEVKTRQRTRRGQAGRFRDEPISIFVTLRRFGAVEHVDQLIEAYDQLREKAELLANERVVPDLLGPIARQITSSNA